MGRFRDLTGQRFNYFVVGGIAGKNKHNKIVWKAVCDCGQERVVTTGDLTTGKAKSCGCKKRELCSAGRLVDMTGMVFGRLTVSSFNGIKSRRTYWSCDCSCGGSCVVSATHLKRGLIQSCGCIRKEALAEMRAVDLRGKRSGLLVAVEEVEGAGKQRYWRCKCDCGGEKALSAARFTGGRVISCGCVKAGRGHVPLTSEKVREQAAAHGAKRRARKLSAGGSWSADQISKIYQLQRGCCAWCGVKLKRYHRDHRKALANGGSNHIHNVEILCAPCNLKKGAKDEIAWANENGRLL